jgi:glycine amidinotransferase
MLSKNEWDPLEVVIVGTATGAKIPRLDLGLRTINYANIVDERNIPFGSYPQQVIEEANEDLETLCDILKKENIVVLRPDETKDPEFYNYCPRDNVLIYDDLILATPQPLKSREKEYLSIDHHLKQYQTDDVKYIKKIAEKKDTLYNLDCLKNKNVLALTETEPSFDAANILRDNDNLYYLVSNTGNKLGAEYLQKLVGNKKIWPIEGVYSYIHIDSTITLLREGLVLLNPSRIKSIDQLPKPLQSWDVIWCPEPVDIGHYPGYCNASTWLNMNLLSISPNCVILEKHQENLRKELKKYKIDSIMVPGRQQRTLGGGFHCVTLDLVRNHS